MRFTLPDGVQYDGTDEDGNDCFRVPMPLDEQGFFGRECPSCGRTFLVCSDDYEALPDDLRLWCGLLRLPGGPQRVPDRPAKSKGNEPGRGRRAADRPPGAGPGFRPAAKKRPQRLRAEFPARAEPAPPAPAARGPGRATRARASVRDLQPSLRRLRRAPLLPRLR